jgi:hypothetical protein
MTKYHVTPKWDGGNLQSARDRFGEQAAIEMFCQKWGTEDGSFAADQVSKIYLYATLDEALAHQRDYGGEILAIDDTWLEVFEDWAEGVPILAVYGEISKADICRL